MRPCSLLHGRRQLNDEPLAYRLDAASRTSGVGVTRLYELIGAGGPDARKAGSRTLITGESLRRYIAGLPSADIQTGRTRNRAPFSGA